MERSILSGNSLSFYKCVLLLLWTVSVQGRLIDLTYDLDETTLHWPTTIPFQLTVERAEVVNNDYWYSSNRFRSGEHLGTHMDAPYHFHKDGWTLEQIPVDRMIAPAVVINISERAKTDPDTALQLEDLEEWEVLYGPIANNSVIIVFTGWGQKWPNKTEYYGSNETAVPRTFHYPVISEEAVMWLVNNRSIVGVGLDTPSVDRGNSSHVHVILVKHNMYILENLANLHLLPPSGATVIALPMKINKGSGAPCRVVAVPKQEDSSFLGNITQN